MGGNVIWMVDAGNKRKRAPSASLAKKRLAAVLSKRLAMERAVEVEEKYRKAGGYGKKVVSCWDVPAGGITNSPAYRKLIVRCGGGSTPPPPRDRAGAPLKGGFPVEKYPPNVLVDGQRAFWLPDDWGQALKNTGPGGVYIGWVSPEGKFFYHRNRYPQAIEETLGRKLTALDGFNGIMRSVRSVVTADADETFLSECLTPSERRHVLPAKKFHFAVVSARRASSNDGMHDIMVVEAHFRLAGVSSTWYVDAESLDDYKALGLNAVVGGKLTPARNMALQDAAREGLVCVQVSDDISKWNYWDVERQDLRGETSFAKANAMVKGSRCHCISPLAAAQYLLAKMRSSDSKPQLGGVFPTCNVSMTIGTEEVSHHHFILGDFFVVDKSPCLFDTSITLKEDYDFTCSHIKEHGCVFRCNRMMLSVKHSTNGGGAVSTRDSSGSKERQNIAILMEKWPGVFRMNGRRKDEVVMNWKRHEDDVSNPVKNKKGTAAKAPVVRGRSAETKQIMRGVPLDAIVRCTAKKALVAYIKDRCQMCHLRTVKECLDLRFIDKSGSVKPYRSSDLLYDIKCGRLDLVTSKRRVSGKSKM